MKVVIAIALALAACSPAPVATNSADAAADGPNAAAAVTEPALATPGSPAQAFADATAAGNAFKLAAGNIAKEKATTPALRKYAKMLADDAIQSTMKLKVAAAQVPGVLANPSLDDEQNANIATLQSATGTAFDQAFVAQQAIANRKMLAAQQAYAASGDADPLRAFAGDNAPFVLRAVRLGKGL